MSNQNRFGIKTCIFHIITEQIYPIAESIFVFFDFVLFVFFNRKTSNDSYKSIVFGYDFMQEKTIGSFFLNDFFGFELHVFTIYLTQPLLVIDLLLVQIKWIYYVQKRIGIII